MKKNKENIVLGSVLAVVAVALFCLSEFTIAKGRQTFDAAFLPQVAAGLMFICSCVLIAQGIFIQRRGAYSKPESGAQPHQNQNVDQDGSTRPTLRLLIAALIFVAYVMAIDLFGFLLSSIVAALALQFLMGTKKWYQYIIVAAAILCIYFLFNEGLKVQFPTLF